MTQHHDLSPEIGSIIREMFLHTADENYIVARWSYDNQLMTDFFWNAVHALEKYMKAVLLFNGLSVKPFGHELVEIYGNVEKLAGALLPTQLIKPETLEIAHWVDHTPQAFLQALDQNGNADNRYLTFGFSQHPWYLPMVDTMVWTIRRLALPLDRPIVASHRQEDAPTHRAILSNQPAYAPNHMEALDKLINAPDSDLRRALLNNNCAFAPADFPHEARRTTTSVRNPVLLRRIILPLQSERDDVARHGYGVATWLLAHTKQSAAVRKEIDVEMKAALARHPGIDQ